MDIQGYIPHFFSSWDKKVPTLTGNKESEYERARSRSTSYSLNIDDSYKNYRGYAAFENYFLQSGVSEERLPFFANLAKLESGFNPTIQNTAGYPAWGYFQFMDGSWKDSNGKTRSASNVRSIAGVSVNEFLNNPVLQIQSANKLADMFLNMFSKRDIRVAREKGYTDSALIAGAWAGGVGGVRKWLHKGYNAVDVSVRNSSSKSRRWKASVAGRMEEFNGYFKNGGTLSNPKEARRIMKALTGGTAPEENEDLFGMSEYHGPTPTWDDLYNFTASYETFNPKVYWLKNSEGKKQELIGHGIALSSVDEETAKRWRANGITEEESLKWMHDRYKYFDDYFSENITNYKYLPMWLRVPILDAAYNTSGTNFFTKSKNLKTHIENGDHYITIAAELDHSMNHSIDEDNKDIGSWLAVRSAARRAMALGEYDYNWQHKDKYGRHILPGQFGPQDWKFSPYYNKYKTLKTDYADYFR